MRPSVALGTMTPMLSANDDDVPVLVVGAGPAGLAAAIELARHDIRSLLIERRTLLSSHPRATVLSLRSMELVRAWGLESEVRARSVEVDSRMLESETLADAAAGTTIAVGYPNLEQSRMVSPTAPACVAQDELEPLLLERLRAGPRACVELGTELTGIVAGSDGVRADLRDVRTGALRTVHARYVVAADGARSAVRLALGISLVGPENLMEGATTLFRAPLWDVVGEHRHLLYSVTHPAAPAVFLPAGRSDLGWKLGWVLRGWAAPALLDSYEAERRPVAEYTAARSADPGGSRRAAEHEVRADLGGRIAHIWTGERSTLDLLEPGLTLFAARGAPAWDSAAASLATRVPIAVRLLDQVAARAVGAPAGSALLARPDGTPVGVLPAGADPLPSLRAAVAAVAA